jgi:NADPH2:quinone reductase
MRIRVIRLHSTGAADALRCEETDLFGPGAGEVLVRQHAAGVNFIDIYQRTGLYPLGQFPHILGVEGAGVVEAIGAGVDENLLGRRVAWGGLPGGGYAEARLLSADRVVPLPDELDMPTAGAIMLRGLTAHMLLRTVWPLRAGESILVQAAAGGLGLILVQWAKRLGAVVIGTAGNPEKAEIARANGADHVINYRDADLPGAIREITGGRGVDFAIDGIGGDSLLQTLECVRPFGVIASVGQACGWLPPFSLDDLGPRRSLSIARPSVMAYAADPLRYRAAAADVLDHVRAGLKPVLGATYPLAAAAEAHRSLEGGSTTGAVVLIP